MKIIFIASILVVLCSFYACNKSGFKKTDFKYLTEQFADIRILRYPVPGFEQLSLQEKKLLYYLYQAALSGRDIFYDQNYKHNLTIRRTLEAIVNSYTGNKDTEEFKKFMVYTKRVWFSNGIHHHYSTDKFLPEFSEEYFKQLILNSPSATFPCCNNETPEALADRLIPIMFDPEIDAKRVNLNPDADLMLCSANNYYEGVTQKEAEAYYAKKIDNNDPQPVSYGLNSKMVKDNDAIKEIVWKVGGMYTEAIEKIVYWLEQAVSIAENDKQKAALEKLIDYYQTGDLRTFDDYCITWVQDKNSKIDVINGFIETYGDPMDRRGAYESVVSVIDADVTRRIKAISDEAQWFENNSPISDEFKKRNVSGVSANVVNVVVESGDASPSTPIGINLPNANWIRTQHGSKSVTLGNLTDAYSEADKITGFIDEFGYSQELIALEKKYGTLADNLHTDMHEVIGHGSGKIREGVGMPKETLKNYASTIEEARADLVALYYLTDPKLVKIGVMPDLEVGIVGYIDYIRNGLMTQLRRIRPGDNIEQPHMRNRQMIAKWVYEKGLPDNVIEKKIKDGKTYIVINNYNKLRALFGELLTEVQRITSEGDYEAAQHLVETYGVKVDTELHKEVLQRFATLNIAPYTGFINPRLVPVKKGNEIVDVKIEYPEDFTAQMLEYAEKYSLLPDYN